MNDRADDVEQSRQFHEFAFLLQALAVNFAFHVKRACSSPVPLLAAITVSAVNNVMFMIFWLSIVGSFGSLGGYGRKDILVLWGVTTIGFGTVFLLFGEVSELAQVIYSGRLDMHMLSPISPLVSLLMGSVNLAYIGDVIFGWTILLGFCGLSTHDFMLTMLAVVIAAALLVGLLLTFGSLAFWTSDANTVGGQVVLTFTQLAGFPGTAFGGFLRLILFIVVPVEFVSMSPIHIVKFASLTFVGIAGAAACLWLIVGYGLFYFGLRSYSADSRDVVNL